MPTSAEHQAVDAYLLELYGRDPYRSVYDASEVHREHHEAALAGSGKNCGVYASDPVKAHLLGTLAGALKAERILEIGGGLGYSALWLARGAPPDAHLDTIDRFPQHVALIGENAATFGLSDRIAAIEGEADDILPSLPGPFDFIHDDGWFGKQPAYLDDMLALLRPGGTLAISNWFLIEQAFAAEPNMDWSLFAGPSWKSDVRAYAAALVARHDLDVSFISRPWLAIAVKRP